MVSWCLRKPVLEIETRWFLKSSIFHIQIILALPLSVSSVKEEIMTSIYSTFPEYISKGQLTSKRASLCKRLNSSLSCASQEEYMEPGNKVARETDKVEQN